MTRKPNYFLVPLNIMFGFAIWGGVCLFAYAENGARHLLTSGLASTFVSLLLLAFTILVYALERKEQNVNQEPEFVPYRGYTRRQNG